MKKLERTAILIMTTMLAFASVCCSGKKEYKSLTRAVFSSGMLFTASVCGDNAQNALDEMSELLDAVGASVSVKDENSCIARFNAAGDNEKIEVDRYAYYLACEAKRIYEQTDGAFNIALGVLSVAWNVDIDGINAYGYGSAQPNALPEKTELETLANGCKLDALECSEENGKYYLKKTEPSLTLDLGGIAKGYCTDACRDIAIKNGAESALINLSGNIALVGKRLTEETTKDWGVGVNNPRIENSSERYVCGFYDADCSIATSGDYERRYFYDYGDGERVRICHIINGKTLLPVGVEYDETTRRYKSSASYVISATVRGESAMLCDAYATAVCVLGLENGIRLLNEVGYDGIVFTSDGKYAVVGEFELDESTTLYKTEYSAV